VKALLNVRLPAAPIIDWRGHEGRFWVDSSGSVAVPRTAGIGATSPLPCALKKVPSRSDLPTFVKRIAGRRFVEFTTYALASRLIASLDGGEGDKGDQDFH